MSKSKEELAQLLRSGLIDEFNKLKETSNNGLTDFTEVDLSGCDISEANLSNFDLSGSDLSECEINHSDFSNSDLTSVNFSRSNFKQTDFTKSVLAGTKFNGASVLNCDFAETDVSGTDFCDTDLTGSDLGLAENMSMCIFDNYTIWPDSDNLPEDFDSEYVEDLSSLKDNEDYLENNFEY